jgi:hypothetical protein
MIQDDTQIDLPLQQVLRDAYAGDTGCPAPEVFLDAAEGRLAQGAVAEIADHVQRCPACAAEARLAREFAEAGPSVSEKDVDYVSARLAAVRPWGRAAVPAQRRMARWRVPLALAASVLVAVALLRVVDLAPELPGAPDTDVMRGSFVDPVAPRGDIQLAPDSLQWMAVLGADYYRVQIRTIDDSVLWEARSAGTSAVIPGEVQDKLNASVTYYWQVGAYNAAGEPLARSTPTDFRILPGPVRP